MKSVCCLLCALYDPLTPSSTDQYALIKVREAEVEAWSLRGLAASKGGRQGRPPHMHGSLEVETQTATSIAAPGRSQHSLPRPTSRNKPISEWKGQLDTNSVPALALN